MLNDLNSSTRVALGRISLVGFFLLCGVSICGADSNPSRMIDALVEKGYARHKVTPNEPTDDETFVRRVYLDIAGRIPTPAEIDAFLKTEGSAKRYRLITELLQSDAYTSHFFNYWADILRVKSNIDGEAGAAYADWLKNALYMNKPYDEMVKELITAEGYVWDNGAVGYYLRDAGMPLDNMSNTTQIFLGTQLVCAQCHNHPFDQWKQKEYYEMAAYTYGVDTQQRLDELVDISRQEKRLDRREETSGKKRLLRNALQDLLDPLRYKVDFDEEKMLALPRDYQYDDADPGEEVRPSTIFGKHVGGSGSRARGSYAEWMVSPENPRFTKVVANRLWKKVMGVGLIEPVDDFREDTVENSPNRELLEYLERLMIDVDYDMKRFLACLYNTRTYQREATGGDVDVETYRFPGPVLQRMSAEQVWDSLLTLTMPDVDHRKRGNAYAEQYAEMRKRARAIEAKLAGRSEKEIIDTASQMADVEWDYEKATEKLRRDLAAARDQGRADEVKALNERMKVAREARDKEVERLQAEFEAGLLAQPVSTGSAPFATKMDKMDEMSMERASAAAGGGKVDDSRWKGYSDDYYRASELSSPAPTGHFLRLFGQSDRETIENAEDEPSVPQVLALLNGKVYDQLVDRRSVLSQGLETLTTNEERQDFIFLSLLSRLPTAMERELLNNEFKGVDPEEAARGVIWTLINTQEFLFVQ